MKQRSFIQYILCLALLMGTLASCNSQTITPSNTPNNAPAARPTEAEIRAADEKRLAQLAKTPSYIHIEVITDVKELNAIRKKHHRKTLMPLTHRLTQKDPQALAELKAGLRSPDEEIQFGALRNLSPLDEIPADALDAETATLVKGLMKQPGLREAAMYALPVADPENAHLELEPIIKAAPPEDYDRMAAISSLSNTQPHNSSIQLLGNILSTYTGKPTEVREPNTIIFSLSRLYPKATAEQQRLIEALVKPYFESRSRLQRISEMAMIMEISKTAHPTMLPFFEKQLPKEGYENEILPAIAKIKGEDAQSLVQDYATQCDPFVVIESITYAWKGDPEGALEEILPVYESKEAKKSRAQVLDLLWKMGGKDMVDEFITEFEGTDEERKLKETLHLLFDPLEKDHPLPVAANRLHALGFIPTALSQAQLEAIQRKGRTSGNINCSEELLEQMHGIVMFDPMTRQYPNPYDDLFLNKFVPGSRGKLQGLEVYMKWDEDSEGSSEEVWVIFNGKGYNFFAEQNGLNYDQNAIEAVLWKVLEDAGVQERFIPWADEDQMAAYIFGEPKAALEVIRLLKLEAHGY